MSHWIWGSERVELPSLHFGGRLRAIGLSSNIRVATKYPKITERYFNQHGVPVEIIKLYGSIELAPIVGLADRIVDLVETGNTLKAHDLIEVGCIAQSTARLIVNRASLKLKHAGRVRISQKAPSSLRQASAIFPGRSTQAFTRKWSEE